MNDEPELLPYSVRRRRLELEQRLPQDRSQDEDINAVVDEQLRLERRDVPVNLGFSRLKGRR
ncbi:hypothetical protein [Bradyrhizobium sp. 188]|uniref:hypothetical protein n=1 Tax=Bradyrhizobium sp. 188 TaxID=2782656 RepID=UPI001FF8F37F|nr:hypothetical protein [Bradyrhizobium sp. 188]MCK1501490.1 hypothetical protein [Bradyrhizobium sp. 188]